MWPDYRGAKEVAVPVVSRTGHVDVQQAEVMAA